MKKLPKVTFGYVNCNRLFYLKSAVESLIYCTEDYTNKEIIIIDNASSEEGTKEYLDSLEARGYKTIRTTERDPTNEFARGINSIIENSTGDYICIMQGDSQFIVKGRWLHEYVKFYQEHPEAGCIAFDAQRRKRNLTGRYSEKYGDEFKFVYDYNRFPTSGAGRVMYSRKVVEILYPWSTKNKNHEATEDSETKARAKFIEYMANTGEPFYCAMPIVPVMAGIYTYSRGTQARVTANGLVGSYWPPKKDFRYYEITDYDEFFKDGGEYEYPLGIEKAVKPIGFEVPIDENGDWIKNPLILNR